MILQKPGVKLEKVCPSNYIQLKHKLGFQYMLYVEPSLPSIDFFVNTEAVDCFMTHKL